MELHPGGGGADDSGLIRFLQKLGWRAVTKRGLILWSRFRWRDSARMRRFILSCWAYLAFLDGDDIIGRTIHPEDFHLIRFARWVNICDSAHVAGQQAILRQIHGKDHLLKFPNHCVFPIACSYGAFDGVQCSTDVVRNWPAGAGKERTVVLLQVLPASHLTATPPATRISSGQLSVERTQNAGATSDVRADR